MDGDKKILVFIPAYNAASTLPLVIDRIPESIKKKVKIIVIDNASPDNTYLTAIGYKEDRGLSNLEIIRNEQNRGYGGSQKRAYQYSIDNGFDIVVMLHGDAQYAPEYMQTLLEPVEKGQADLVFGSRMRGEPLKGGMPVWRFIGNRVLTMIENKVLDLNLSEFHSGYRVYSVEALKKIPFQRCSNDYHFDTDIFIQLKIGGFRIAEQPIPTHYDKRSRSPTVWETFNYSFNILKAMLEYLLHKNGFRIVGKFDFKV